MRIQIQKENLPFLFFFFAQGAFNAQTTSPLPAIKEVASVTDSQIGTGIIIVGIGMLIGLALFGKISSRIESRTVMKWAGLAMLLWGPCLSLGLSCSVYNVLGLLFGIALGLFQGARNVQGILHERQCGRNVMGVLYAGSSLGNMAGCLMTSVLMGGLGVSLGFRLSLFSIVFCLLGFFACRYLLADTDTKPSKADKTKPIKSKIPFIVFLMGIMSLGALDLQAMVVNWGAILLDQTKGAPASISALSYAAAAFGMFFSRLFCDNVRGWLGTRRTILFGVLLAWGGLLFAVYIPNPLLALLGFFFLGLGVAPIYPTLMSAVGRLPGVNIAHAATIVSWVGNAGFLTVPGLQGVLAESNGIETAFLSAILISVITLLGSFVLKEKKG